VGKTEVTQKKIILHCNLGEGPLVSQDQMPTDAELIRRIIQGEQSLFALLVERYRAYVFTLTLRQLGNREDAEEVAQDVFVKAYRSLADFRGDARFSTWLYTIVRTCCISRLRTRKPASAPLEGLNEPHAEDKTLETRNRRESVNRAIRLLGPEDAQVVTLFYQGEQSLEEIGRIMGLEPNTVKVRLHRARGRLKEVMARHFAEDIKAF